MLVFLLLLVVVYTLLISFAISVVRFSRKILTTWISSKVLLNVTSLLPLGLLVIGIFIDSTNAITVDIYAGLIILLNKLLFKLIQRIISIEINEYIILAIGVILSVLVLSYAYYKAYHVVETKYQVVTTKELGTENFRIVQIADSHIGTTMDGKKFAEYMEKINQINPDVVVITGDFVDDNSTYQDMLEAAKGLGNLKTKYGVYYVYGNHDKGYYHKRDFKDPEMRKALQDNNVVILEDEMIHLTDYITIIGRQDVEMKNRKSAQELTADIDKNKYIIMLDHQPNDYENERKSKVDLVLSGHTHGGQVFPLGQLGVLLKANDFMYGKTQRENTTFIVTSGISDWAMKFKIGCKSEYVVIDVIK